MSTATAERGEVEMAGAGGSEIGLADLMTRMDERFDRVDEKFDRVDEKFERIDERFERIDERFDRVDSDIGALNHRMDRAEDKNAARFELIERRIDRLGNGLVAGAIALSGSIVACFAAMIVLIATQL